MSTTDPAPTSPLPVEAACKIDRGQGVNLIFTDSTTYERHIATMHPDSMNPPPTTT